MSIIKHNINSIDIGHRPEDGYINITKMAKAAGKKASNYLRTQETKDFLHVLSKHTSIPVSEKDFNKTRRSNADESSVAHIRATGQTVQQKTPQNQSKTVDIQSSSIDQYLLEVRQGGSQIQGTWAHPKVAIHCAQWCSPEFAVMVTNWVFDWMNSGQTPNITPLPEPEPQPLSLPEPSTNEECDFTDRLQQLKELVALGDRLGLEDSDRLMLKRRWRELIHLPNGEREISIAERAEDLGYKPTPIELIRIGQIASSFYRDRHGAAPEKRKQYCGNVERSVNVYRHGDLIVIDSAIEAVMGKKR